MVKTAQVARRSNRTGGTDPIDRNMILDAAATVFSERGYRATNLSIVAETLGVTRQALYHHFPHKDAILFYLFDRTMSLFEVRVLSAKEETPGGTFVAMLREHARICIENSALIMISQTEDRELPEDLLKQVLQRRKDYHRQFVNAYSDGVASGELRPTDEVSASVSFMLAACHATAKWRGSSSRMSSRALTDMVTSLLCDGSVVSNETPR